MTMTSKIVIASDGTPLDLDSLTQTLSYTAGVLQYIEVTTNNLSGVSKTYRQTLTYSGTDMIGVSKYIPQ